MHAVRNISLCTKDCVCLFVCPTGATNTEIGQIDAGKCLDGCRRCVDACPSHAIALVMDNYPVLPPKDHAVSETLLAYLQRRSHQELRAKCLASQAAGTRLAKALALSIRIVAEDCAREAGYLLPQSAATRDLLRKLLGERMIIPGKPFPEAAIQELLERL
jgi:Fe-S-cluster-containing hydrogenase component 2